jgi:DNA-binding beta-propeller fold protein YncE
MTLHPSFPGWLFVADAGMNTVWQVEVATGRVRTLARFANVLTGIPARPFAEAVPTSVQPYGDQLLVTQLSGVPFVPGTARVSILDPATGTVAPFISWASTAMDIAWEERPGGGRPTFYLLEFSAALAQTPPLPGRIRRWVTLEEDLFVPALRTPTSMALDSAARALFVTNRSEGTLLKVALP